MLGVRSTSKTPVSENAMNAGTAWYALKRIAAYAIDLALVWAPLGLLLEFGQPFLKHAQPRLQLFTWVGAWGFTAVGPVLINGILTGLTGRSPGKFIMFLNVQDFGGDPPGIANRDSSRDHQGGVAGVFLRHDLGTSGSRNPRPDVLRSVAEPRG